VSRTVKDSLPVAERKAVAETLREWAAWCEANPDKPWGDHPLYSMNGEQVDAFFVAFDMAKVWCKSEAGPTAALGLYFAAAMVEAGDSV